MKITKAIPVRLQKSNLNEQELEELRTKYSERVMTLEEIEEREAEEAANEEAQRQGAILEARRQIIQALDEIDRKSIRALREGNAERIKALEDEAAVLRVSLK